MTAIKTKAMKAILATNILACMSAKGWSPEDLYRESGVGLATLKKYTDPKTKGWYKNTVVEKIATAFEKTLEQMKTPGLNPKAPKATAETASSLQIHMNGKQSKLTSFGVTARFFGHIVGLGQFFRIKNRWGIQAENGEMRLLPEGQKPEIDFDKLV